MNSRNFFYEKMNYILKKRELVTESLKIPHRERKN